MVRGPPREQVAPPLRRIVVGRVAEILVAVAVLTVGAADMALRWHRFRFDLHLNAARGRVYDGVVAAVRCRRCDATDAGLGHVDNAAGCWRSGG